MAIIHGNFYSKILENGVQLEIALPEPVRDGAREPLPVLYLLHGNSDDATVWQRRTSIERYAGEYGLAVVMPGVQRGSAYTDQVNGEAWYTYIAREVPDMARRYLKVSQRPEDTFVAGLSMGGYGALKCGLLAPETFSAVASLSGGVDAVEIASNDAIKGNDGLFFDIFGPADKVKGSDNDLFAVAERLAKRPEMMPKVYMWCGTEDFLYQSNLRMRDHLRALGYDLTYEESPGDHQWKYWDTKIQTVLDWLPIKL